MATDELHSREENEIFEEELADGLRRPAEACVFVANLSPDTQDESIRRHFSQFGQVAKLRLMKDRAMRPSFAFVQFLDVQAAVEVLKPNVEHIVDERKLRVEHAKVNRTLFIAKLPRQMGENELQEVCAQYGTLESVSIIKNKETGLSKGCGFVKYEYREDALKAFACLRLTQAAWVTEWAKNGDSPDSTDHRTLFIGGLNPVRITQDLLLARFQQHGVVENATLVNRESSDKSAFAFVRYANVEDAKLARRMENGQEWLERRIRVQVAESPDAKPKRRLAGMAPPFPPMPGANQQFPMYLPPIGDPTIQYVPIPYFFPMQAQPHQFSYWPNPHIGAPFH